MNLRAAVAVSALTLLLVGCSGTPQVERDESSYIHSVRALAGDAGEYSDDAALVEQGDAVCDMARTGDERLSEGLTYLDNLLSTPDTTAAQRDYWAAVVSGAATFLCQDVA